MPKESDYRMYVMPTRKWVEWAEGMNAIINEINSDSVTDERAVELEELYDELLELEPVKFDLERVYYGNEDPDDDLQLQLERD